LSRGGEHVRNREEKSSRQDLRRRRKWTSKETRKQREEIPKGKCTVDQRVATAEKLQLKKFAGRTNVL